MSKHTPGEWRVCGADQPGKPCPCFLISTDGCCIATWYGDDSGGIDGVGTVPDVAEGQANAHLIAAAPDYYDAVEAFMSTANVVTNEKDVLYVRTDRSVWENLYAAHAKAKGETP